MIPAGNPFSLSGKTVLVTGAGSGLGRASSIRLAASGAVVIAAGRTPSPLEATLAECTGSGHRFVAAELTDPAGLAALVQSCGPLDGVVHSAGICEVRPARSTDTAFLRKLLDLNLAAPLLLNAALLREGRLASGASVVFIGSVSASCGETAMSVYAAGKGGLESAARALAVELAPKPIRVNVVSPGSMTTPLLDRLLSGMTDASKEALVRRHPLGLGNPDDVACAVVYLLSPAARWVTGTTLEVDGGYSAK